MKSGGTPSPEKQPKFLAAGKNLMKSEVKKTSSKQMDAANNEPSVIIEEDQENSNLSVCLLD